MAFHSMERSKVQCLYDGCNAIFSKKEGYPTLEEIRWLQSLLDPMEAIDVGIDGSNDERSRVDPKSRKRLLLGHEVTEITYVHIHECDDFSMGVFCFPAGAKLPLHDHPHMVVLSKVLYGSVSMKAYDWVNSTTASKQKKKGGLARVVSDNRILQASCKSSTLFPRSGGNIHSFTALTPCAILDVLSPPYSEDLGRPSSYFSELHIPSLPGFAILEKKEVPDDLVVLGAPYLGPRLIMDGDFF